MSKKVRIGIFDDHPLFRHGVQLTLEADAEFEVVALGSTAAQALQAAQIKRPDVMLLDVNMPGGGIKAAQDIAEACPTVSIVMLTVSEQEDHLSAAMAAGARGYALKGISGDALMQIVRSVVGGEAYVSPSLAARVLRNLQKEPTQAAGGAATGDNLYRLTAREQQILTQLSGGMTNKEIARALDLSEKTIKHYVTNILQKLQVRNRVEAALSFRMSSQQQAAGR
jgi:DNA-binding NarL/FixJ family response regulator